VAQAAVLQAQLVRVMALHGLSRNAVLVSAGCGEFLVPSLLTTTDAPAPRCVRYTDAVAKAAPGLADRVQVCAPSVAVGVAMAMAMAPG